MKIAGQQPAGDDGAAPPRLAASLAAYASGLGGEHAVLAALAGSRLLVPVVARPRGGPAAGEDEPAPGPAPGGPGARGGVGHGRHGGEKTTEMALPTVIGNDGRHALLAFSSLAALTRWRRDARPVPVPAARVWQAAADQASAVVLDIAGPVPLAIDGERLAALAAGRPVPPPHADPDVAALAARALAGEPAFTGCELRPGRGGSDLMLALTLAPGLAPASAAVQAAAGRAVAAIMAGAGATLRRGIEVTLAEPDRAV
jgi:type III secretion system (T3SS) SseB-like protein